MRGFILIAFGILYLMKPDLFRKNIFMKDSNNEHNRTPEEHRKYMRKIATILIIIGSVLLAYDYQYLFFSQGA
jgi:hypothetical protein